MYDVICIGSSSIDLFVESQESIEEYSSGDKVLINSLREESGGGAFNSSVGLSRMGCKTGFLGKIGNDLNGKKIYKELRQEGVSIIPVKKSQLRTAYSVIIQSRKDKDRIIFSYKGASNDLKLMDFNLNKIKSKWVYTATFLEESLKTAESMLQKMKKEGSKILLNPSRYLVKQPSRLKNILKITDVLILNKQEAQLLIKKQNSELESSESALSEKILTFGPKAVVITNGDRGIYYYDGIQKIKLKALKSKPISTTGAGDAFASAFLAGLIHQKDVKTSLNNGLKNAKSVIEHIGAKNKLLTWDEVNK